MASYLSYFTSNSSSAPTQQQYQQAQPATSTWTSTVSSRLATLRKALTKDSEEDDPDYEDCSHVSNVLRAYYTQKGRAHPEWLPADPKKPVAQAPAQQYGQYGNMYGNQYGAPTHNRASSGGRGGLSDLWDSGPAQSAPTQQPQSLRAPRQTPQSLRSSENVSRPVAQDPYSTPNTTTARPLPSQRAGSYQTTPAATAASKADRLRARLQGGGSGRNSPASIQFSSESYSDTDNYSNQSYGGNNAGARGGGGYNPSSQDSYDSRYGNSGNNVRGYGDSAYRQRPGGPR